MKSHKKLSAFMALTAMLVLSISMVAAASINLEPKEITISLYPGENVSHVFNVTTDGFYPITLDAEILNNASYVSVAILNSTPIAINHFDTLPLTFILSNDSNPGTFKLKLITKAFITDPVVIPIPERSGSSGGSGGGSYVVKKTPKESDKCFYTTKNGTTEIQIACDSVPKVSTLYNTSFDIPAEWIDFSDSGEAQPSIFMDSESKESFFTSPVGIFIESVVALSLIALFAVKMSWIKLPGRGG